MAGPRPPPSRASSPMSPAATPARAWCDILGELGDFRCWHETDMPTALRDVRSQGAGSTGRRNTGVKSLCWSFKLQGLTWPFVELTSHFVQIGLRVHRQVGALREVLSQQAVGVLVRPALPRALRIAKIYVDCGRQRKATMIRKFLSPVPGQGLIQLLW